MGQCCADRETAEHIHHLQHLLNAAICSCMLTQQSIELTRIQQDIESQPYQGPPPFIYAALPPQQQQMVDARQALRDAPQQPFLQGAAAMPGQPVVGGLVADGRQIQVQQPQQQPRQVMVTVPPGTFPGQMVTFTNPDNQQMQAAVPNGVAPGQAFPVYC